MNHLGRTNGKITVDNYDQAIKDLAIDFKELPETALKSHNFTKVALKHDKQAYKKHANYKKLVDDWIAKLNAFIAKKTSSDKPKAQITKSEAKSIRAAIKDKPPRKRKTPKRKSKRQISRKEAKSIRKAIKDKPPGKTGVRTTRKGGTEARTRKARTLKPLPGSPVADVSIEVKFLKSYIGMDGKRKTRLQLTNFLTRLQRSIEKKHIEKTSKYATEIRHIQKEIVNILNDKDTPETFTFKLDGKDNKLLAKIKNVAGSQHQRTSVRLISRYLGIQGRLGVKERANRLITAIANALKNGRIPKNDPYIKEVKQVQKSLENYVDAQSTRVEISEVALRGLQGICSCSKKKTVARR